MLLLLFWGVDMDNYFVNGKLVLMLDRADEGFVYGTMCILVSCHAVQGIVNGSKTCTLSSHPIPHSERTAKTCYKM